MKGKYIQLSSQVGGIFLIMDKLTIAIASGTTQYVQDEIYIAIDPDGVVKTIRPYEIGRCVPLSEIKKDVLDSFSKFYYNH